MRLLSGVAVAVILGGCGGAHPRNADGRADTTAAQSVPGPAVFAGAWQVRSVRQGGDSVVGFKLTATPDTVGWTLQFPGRAPIPLRVVARGGDSVSTEAEPYESVLRPGVRVRTSSTFHLRLGRLVGTTVARYSVVGPDSVLRLRNTGVRLR